jgi:BlaI family penicillinase repressor
METVWRDHPASASEVIAALGVKSGWKPNTIRTLLARLVKKGALAYSESGNRYIYAPRFTRQEHVACASESFLDRIFGGTARELLMHFVESGKLTKRDIADLKRILEQPGK